MTEKKQKINLTLIRNLAHILNETDLTEVEINSDGTHIRLLRSPKKTNVTGYYPKEYDTIEHPSTESTKPPVSETTHQHDNVLESSDPSLGKGHIVTSPMVGTAYLANNPGSDPFVKQGDTVIKGQTLLIIEAMKTMNHIVAPCSGKVRNISVKDGQLLEYGEQIMVLECEEDNV
ncbi:MAG: acetyl-CoA carboxylase biotin carboxyl carrier protein subunit [Candidatus Liberibacter ctenarytainae]|uniref:Biotin carboxyl carrier protein of acetyl-CoA carboxylase n=1 Tax=Candidatus Liberibacter ctenarytainae TaxID=2020335 RepID=A0A937ALX8_9HYPH|nr:acetyl-CoA carboxylase biotin carboxyl carrier protein subunit [Candidatus Liberibacter ctenarytainae]